MQAVPLFPRDLFDLGKREKLFPPISQDTRVEFRRRWAPMTNAPDARPGP